MCVCLCVHHAKTCRYSTPVGKASPKLSPYLPYTTNHVPSFSLALFVAPKRNGSGYRFALLSTIQVHYTISLYHQAYTATYGIGTSHCHLPVRCLQNPYTYCVPGCATSRICVPVFPSCCCVLEGFVCSCCTLSQEELLPCSCTEFDGLLERSFFFSQLFLPSGSCCCCCVSFFVISLCEIPIFLVLRLVNVT